jgi:glycerol-3-phosphate acyltransferase PlsY
MNFAALVILGYLLGSCPWGVWIVKLVRGEDIRKVGSGNIGATNVWRMYGRWLGIPVVSLDLLKGFVPALLGAILVSPLCGIAAGVAAMIGHWRPLFLKFAKGGKIVATGGGVFFGVAPWVGLIALLVWIVVFLVSRYASLGSIVAALSLPVTAFTFGYSPSVMVLSFGVMGGVLYLHRVNIARLRNGTESRFSFRRTARA